MNFAELYGRANYKMLMLIPLAMLFLSVGLLAYNHQTTGEWFERSADLKGGTQITVSIEGEPDIGSLQKHLETQFGDVSVRELGGVGGKALLISVPAGVDVKGVMDTLAEEGITVKDSSTQQVGPALGEAFWRQSQLAFFVAFVFMAFVVFLAFRTFIPSIAVIQAAVTDVLGTIAMMQLLGIEMSLAGFAAIMLIIGYSVDTDILLTARVLRGSGPVTGRVIGAMKTGLTMTLTALVALIAMYATSSTPVISDIAAVLIIALILDIPATYLMNAGILRWWMEKRGAHE